MLQQLVFSLIVLWTSIAQAAIEIPKAMPQELVADYAETLTAEQHTALSQKLREYFVASSNVVVVVTIPSLEAVGQPTLQDWNMTLADTWKPGNAQKSNGVIVTILGTKAPYKVRINPGRGLEGPLTDAFCKRLIEDMMKPVLNKTGGYYDGINVAVDGLVKQIGQEFSPEKKQEQGGEIFLSILFAVSGCAAILGLGLLAFRSRERRTGLEQTSTRPSYTSSRSYSGTARRSESSQTRSRSSEGNSWSPTSSFSDTSSSPNSPGISVDTGGSFSGGGAGD